MFNLLLAIIYMSFISLGLPDALLGSAWPEIHLQFGVAVSSAGVISMIIAMGTIVSSLMSDRLTHRLGTGKVTAISVAITAVSLMGFSLCDSFVAMCLWAIPYGLGAGSVDASINNYVALHYSSRHMSWLHCMWGIGASAGPYIMGSVLTAGLDWTMGYRVVCFIQIVLTIALFFSLPLWDGNGYTTGAVDEPVTEALPLTKVVKIKGAVEIMVTFFCYCALEATSGLWASSWLVMEMGVDSDIAAGFAAMFYTGITVGRFVCGFITMKLNDTQMIRMGQAIILAGILLMLLPLGIAPKLAALVIIGIGCAPVYPCIIHSTPQHFGREKSRAMIGVQMASAYTGTCLMPPAMGLIAQHIDIGLFPVFLLAILVLMIAMHEKMLKKTNN